LEPETGVEAATFTLRAVDLAPKTVIGNEQRDLPGMTSAATQTKFERTRPRSAFQSGAS
jgi:hypothetical protein